MKISVVIQHYNRKTLLINTLNSIKESLVKNSDIEIIIIDDASDDHHNIDDLEFLYPDFNIKTYTYKKEEKWWTCPVIPANKGISMATGDVVILLGAECMFIGDIIKDVLERIKSNDYLVYATLALSKEDTDKIDDVSYKYLLDNTFTGDWYQHSIHKNNCYNFCTAIMREDLLDLGGFDERYASGVEYGDDDFILRVRRKGMDVISIDYPMTYHQNHEGMSYQNFREKIKTKRINNFSGGILFKHVLENEVDYKVKNSYLLDSNYVALEPDLEEKYIYTKFKVILKKNDDNLFVEFLCNVPGLKLNVMALDSIDNNRNIILERDVPSRTWISNSIQDYFEIKLSIQDVIIYRNTIFNDIEFINDYTIPLKIFIPKS